MVYAFLAAGVLVFVISFRLLEVVPKVRAAIDATRRAQGIISSKSLTDEEKETAVQRAAIVMAGTAVVILGRVAVCVLVPTLMVWLGAQSGAYSTADALVAASNWTFITVSSVVMIAALTIIR
jgi:hypothetical protein